MRTVAAILGFVGMLALLALPTGCATSSGGSVGDSALLRGEAYGAGVPFRTLSQRLEDHFDGCWRGFSWTTGTFGRQTSRDVRRLAGFFQ